MDAAGTETALRDLEAATFAEQDVLLRHPYVLEQHLGVAVRRVISMSVRASAMRCSHTDCSLTFLPKATRLCRRLTIFSSAASATPMVRMQ